MRKPAVLTRSRPHPLAPRPARSRTPRQPSTLRALLSFLETASQQSSLDGLMGEALAAIAPQYHYEIGGIHLFDEGRERLLLRAHYGAPLELLSHTRVLRPGDGIAGRVAATGLPLTARFPGTPLLPAGMQSALVRHGIRHQLTLPLKAHGKILGTLSLSARKRNLPGRRERNEIIAFAHAFALALELRRQLDRTENAAAEAAAVIVYSGDLIATLAVDAQIMEINPAGRQLLGGNPAGRPLLDFLDRRDHESLREALASGAPAHLQLRMVNPSGWLELTLAEAAPVLEPRGGSRETPGLGIIATGRDITSRKLAELELAQRNQELFALNKISALAASPVALKARLPELLERCLKIAGCDSGALYRRSSRSGELIGVVNQGYGPELLRYKPLQRMPLHQGSLGRLADGGEHVLLNHPDEFEPAAAAAVLKADGVQAGVAIAMRSGERTHGVIVLSHHAPREFDTYELSLITTLAHQLGAAFETQALLQETQGRLNDLQLMQALGKTLAGTLELATLLSATVAHIKKLMQMDGCFVWLKNPEGEGGGMRIAGASEGFEDLLGLKIKASDRSVASEAMRRGELVTSAATHERRKLQRSLMEKSGMRSVMAVPLLVRGAAIGALVCGRRSGSIEFSEDEKRRALTISQPVAIALENARLFDATRRQQAALRALSAEVLRAQEEERRRLSRELHDGVAQSVSALKLSLSALRGKLKGVAPAILREFDELVSLVGDSATEVRRLSADLRPPILDELGLLPTLQAHVEALMRRSRLRIEFRAGELPPLPAGLDINLYRMAQEGLNNILKHAKARHATLTLAADAEGVQLEISDDGAGFDPASIRPSESGGLGLLGMRERAELFGGSLEIQTEQGAGTRLTIHLPLDTV